MRASVWTALLMSLIAASLLAPPLSQSLALAQPATDASPQAQATPVVPSELLPPGVTLPPGIELPPGLQVPSDLSPGNTLPGPSSPAMEILGDDQERLAHGPVPGFGASNAQPSGTPMQLSLRPGWQLTSIRGGATDEYWERCMMGDPAQGGPECVFNQGMFQVTLRFERNGEVQASDLSISQAGAPDPLAPLVPDPEPLAPLVPEPDDPLAPLVPVDAPPLNNTCAGQARWSGWVLDSSGDGQNIWVPVWTCLSSDGKYTVLQDAPRSASSASLRTVAFRALSADEYELTLSGFCLNADRHVPGEEHSYRLGVLSDDPGMARLLQAIKGKRIQSFEDRMKLQSYLWVYTEGQELTDRDWSVVAGLP